MTGDQLYNDALKRLAATPVARLAAPDSTLKLNNPLCGDRVILELRVTDDRIAALGGEVKGCLLCQAALATLVELATGLNTAEAWDLGPRVATMLAGTTPPPLALEPFLPVRPLRSRHACVLLPFEALSRIFLSIENS